MSAMSTVSTVSTPNSAYTASHTPTLASIARQAFWTVNEAALVMRCSARALRSELSRGTVKGIKIGGKWRVPVSQFGIPIAPFVVHENLPGRTSQVEDSHVSDCIAPPDLPQALLQAQATPPPQPAQPKLRLNLLGRPQIFIDDVRLVELERSNRRSELLYLLALHRGGLSGAQLGHMLNATNEKHEDESLDPHYVRTLVWGVRDHTRKKCGWDGVVTSAVHHGRGAQRYMLPENTTCDLWEFQEKLNRADALTANVARLVESSKSSVNKTPSFSTPEMGQFMRATMYTPTQAESLALAATLREEALRLYRGDLCDGSANGCLAEEGSMLEERYISSALDQAYYWRWVALHSQEASKSYFSSITALLEVIGAARGVFPAEIGLSPLIEVDVIPSQRHPHVRAAWREALLNYERILEVDPYYEDACIYAMECYVALGNIRGMNLRFSKYRDVLQANLRQLPSNRIVRALEVFRNKSVSDRARAT